MEWYDTKRLFADADARIVVKAIYDKNDYQQSGSTLFCRCPAGHKETRIDHCAVYKSGCKCFSGSCGARFDTKEIVEKYFEKKGETLSFSEICGKIADAMGGRELYLTSKSDTATRKPQLPIERSDLEVIGVYSPENTPGVPKISSMFEDDPEACKKFLLSRAHQMLDRYDALMASEKNHDLRTEWERRHRITRQIIIKLGGEEEQKKITRLFRL